LTAHFYPVIFEGNLDLSEYIDYLNNSTEGLIFDNSRYFFQLDKKRFYRWIDGVKQPVKAVRLTEEVITDK